MNVKKSNQKECPNCGKKVNTDKTSFCPSCGREIFTPVIDREWSYKIITGIIVVLVLVYVVFRLLSPVLYFYLDKI